MPPTSTPHPGFGSDSVISQFLLHHNVGIFNCKKYKHYFSQTDMFLSNIQFGYPCPRVGGQAVQDNLGIFSCMRYKHYFGQTEMFASYVHFGYPCPREVVQAVQAGLSCPPPRIWVRQCRQSILIIILEYLVVRDINIISVKLRCLVTLVRGVGAKLVYLAPTPPPRI